MKLFTLWILIFGLKNAGGSVTLFQGPLALQPIGTFETQKECELIAHPLYTTMQNNGAAVDVFCLPTGISDPVGAHSTR